MNSLEFNVSGTDQHLVIEKVDGGLNPTDAMTVEALCQLMGDSQDPTVFCLPASEDWYTPFVAWRLGFHGRTRTPEFQLTIEGDIEPTCVRSSKPIGQYQIVHIAGSYDGSVLRLYVDGKLEAESKKSGNILKSRQRPTIGARSSTALGGLMIGRLFELRFWRTGRDVIDIDMWKDKTLPLPADVGLAGLWTIAPNIGAERAKQLTNLGFTPVEISFASFVTAYSQSFSAMAQDVLSDTAKSQFAEKIHTVIIAKALDGYVVVYEVPPSRLLSKISPEHADRVTDGGFFLYDWRQHTIADIIRELSNNTIRVSARSVEGGASAQVRPDQYNTFAEVLDPRLKDAHIAPPVLHIFDEDRSTGNALRVNGRTRIYSPLANLPNGETIRSLSWLFADIWRGELSWEIARKSLAEGLAINDLLQLNLLANLRPLDDGTAPNDVNRQPLLPLEQIIDKFEALISRNDVEEVRDVLPFLQKKEHWIVLSPTADMVWPEKMLGNKWRVDFVVKEANGTYVATEIESPKKKLYKSGQAVEPYAEWTHAEQQVRDYCNFIDMNRDYVEREEALTGIFRPRGLVVIGRRASLSDEGKKKLAERNADNGRYQTFTFDDLLDQARAVVHRLRAIVAPDVT